MRMYPVKILFILWITRSHAAITRQVDCGKEEKYNHACEGSNITLACPKEKPFLEITSANFGRTKSEILLCLRPGNLNPERAQSVKCLGDVTMKVARLCADQFRCVFNVNNLTFHDPCPDVYKYMWVSFNCHCRKRYTRELPKTTPSPCFTRISNSTSFSYTTIHLAPTFTTIGRSMSQSVTISTYQPIRITATPTTVIATQSPRMTAILTSTAMAMSVNSTKNVSLLTQAMRGRSKALLIVLELFLIYNEAANEDPPMALMWCFIGMLLGLFIITITFLILGLRREPRHKDLFRLSQLEPENGEMQSPTIHTTSQFPESPDFERHQETVDKLNSTGSGPDWSDLLKRNSSLYINPLWRGWREEYMSLRGQDGDELDTGLDEEEGLSRSEPWNLGGAGESNGLDQNNSVGQRSHNRDSYRISSHSCSEGDSGNDTNNNNNISNSSTTNQQPDTTATTTVNPELSKSSKTNTDLLRRTSNRGRSITESDNLAASIPVGIPSHPVPDPQIFHTEQSYPRAKKPEVGKAPKSDVTEDDADQLKVENSGRSMKPASNKLLSRFGLNNGEICPTPSLCNTALSSPCLYNEDEELRGLSNKDPKGSSNMVRNSRLNVRSQPPRSRSLDSSCAPETTPLHNTYNALYTPTPHNPTPHNLTSQNATIKGSTTQHRNEPPPFVRNKNDANLLPKVLVHHKPSAKEEQPNHLPVTQQQSKKSPKGRRASSGYYSNNSSPLVEYPGEITAPQNSRKNSEQAESRIKRQKSLCSDDDLPPLPPPPPPLTPISPLPHVCLSGFQEPKTKDENDSNKNPSRTAVRKVHFKSSE